MRDVVLSDNLAERGADERSIRSRHWMMFALSQVALVGAFLLEDCGDGRVQLRCLRGLPLPHTCGSRAVFGVECPACGLTRSVIHLAEGHLAASFASHRLGWLMALLVLLQVPYRLAALWSADGRPLGRAIPRCVGYGLIALLFVNWLVDRLLA